MHVSEVPREARSLWSRVTGSHELLGIGYWEMNVGPLQEEYVLLSNEPYPHPLESLMV